MTMQVATNAAKISRPKVSGIFPRGRLFSQINIHKKQAGVWISSPPGAGKTSLICNYLEQQTESVVWYQVDEGDADLSTFFYYLGQAVQKASPRKRSEIPLLTLEFNQKVTSFARHFFRTVYARFSKNFIFVFDNFQNVADDSDFHQLIALAMEELPENGSFIILSRTQPAADYSRLIANSNLSIIDWEQLKLTRDEVSEIFELKGISQENIPAIMEVTQGWIAGLTLLFEQESNTLFLDKKRTEFNPKRLFNYFVSEVFDRADSDTQRLLIKTAWFPKMTVEMVVQLTGIKRAQEILESLVSKNFFTQRHGNKNAIYEYHPLFREFLLERSKQLLGDIEINVTRWNAAELLENNHQIEAAMLLYQQLEDWDKIATVIKSTARSLMNQGRNFVLQEWLSHIPEQYVEQSPWLLYWLATATKYIMPQASLPLFEQAYQQFKQNEDIAGLYLSWSGVIDSIRIDHGGDTRRLDLWFIELNELRKRYPEYPSPAVEIEVAVYMFAALWWHQPQHKDFDYWKQSALRAASELPNENSYKVIVNSIMTLHLIFSGELIQASYLLNESKNIASQELVPAEKKIFRQIAHGLLDWRRGNWQEAYRHLDKGLVISEESGFLHEYSQIMSIKASVALMENDLVLAKKFIDKHEMVDQGTKGTRYHYMKAWYALLDNQIETALIHSEKSVNIAEETGGMPFFTSLSYLQLAIIQFKLEQDRNSFQSLKIGLSVAEGCHSKSAVFTAKMIEAYFNFSTGLHANGLNALKKALSLGQEQKFIGVSCLSHQETALLCVEALKENIEIEHVKEIIEKTALLPPENAMEIANWPWTIKIFCLTDNFEVLKNNEAIKTSRKAQKKPLSVIKALIAFGGEKVPENKIIEALWPDSDGDTGHQALATTLHRLRKLLGDNVIELKAGKLSLNKQLVWVDVWAFEYNAKRADSEIKSINLYQAQFLESDKGEYWTISPHEILHQKYLSLVIAIGEKLEKEKAWQQACDCYLQALTIDTMAEVLYQRLMQCYMQIDRVGDAIKIYRQCFRLFNTNLGIEPSTKTKQLFLQLQKKKGAGQSN